jgi:hypothetical protein
MNEQLWWYVARAGGIVAWFLLAASVIWGLTLSTKLLGRKPHPAWLLDVHRFLGGLALVFTGVHVVGLVADSYVHFGPSDILVPMASDWRPGPVAWGVVALYLLVAVELTSLAMKRLPRRLWKAVHFASFALFVTASVHGAFAGTDARNHLYAYASVAVVLVTFFLTIVRVLLGGRAARRTRVRVAKAETDESPPTQLRPAS